MAAIVADQGRSVHRGAGEGRAVHGQKSLKVTDVSQSVFAENDGFSGNFAFGCDWAVWGEEGVLFMGRMIEQIRNFCKQNGRG
jgi:hypothetical protein